MSSSLIVVVHNVRSAHNVGSILRSADGFGIEKVILTGYSPYPLIKDDKRLPHISARAGAQIKKTALGAESSVAWEYSDDIMKTIEDSKAKGYFTAAIEQAANSRPLNEFSPPDKLLLVVGNEIGGVDDKVIEELDSVLEIPMDGHKESFNVAVAAAIAMYHCKLI